MSDDTKFDIRHKSRVLVDGPDRAAARSQLHSVGYTRDDLKKPLVMVAQRCMKDFASQLMVKYMSKVGEEILQQTFLMLEHFLISSTILMVEE